MKNESFLSVRNIHGPEDGTPPKFESGQGYLSYFESHNSDQWAFARDRESGIFFVTSGSLGWANHVVGERALRELKLGIPEQLWVLACLHGCGLSKVADRIAWAWQKQH